MINLLITDYHRPPPPPPYRESKCSFLDIAENIAIVGHYVLSLFLGIITYSYYAVYISMMKGEPRV